MSRASELLFITMPWASAIHPSIGVGLLSSILRETNLPSSTLYGNLLMPRPSGPSVYAIDDPGYYEDRTAGLAFVPHLYPETDPKRIGSAVAERYMQLVTREGQLSFDRRSWDWHLYEHLRTSLMCQTQEDVSRARTCLNRCLERIEHLNFDIVGFSLTFETQLIASLALARLIRQRWPDRKIMFGGSACTSVQGVSMLKSFDYIDTVCLGEADTIIVPLVRALRDGASLEHIPGIAFRDRSETIVTKRLEPVKSLDDLPPPDYDAYVEQKETSEWQDTISVLLFETSRGCWWGEKHLCSFCGLNGEALTYRSKTAAKVLDEIRYFRKRWNVQHGLQAVDNILPTRYFSDLVPLLAEEQKNEPVGLFFEIKSNIKREQMFQLASAGFTTIQPGIESFSDHVLTLMDKGANALQQICCIKWGQEVGISITYNILLRNPGERIEDYQEMLELIPFIKHLLPPNGVANMQLERYSPYFMRPEQFGIRNVRPKSHYQDMFPDDRVDLRSLVYQFDFDHDDLDRPELVEIRRKLIEAMLRWRADFKQHQLQYTDSDGRIVIRDRRSGQEETIELQGPQAELYRYLEEPHTFRSIATRFPHLSPTLVRACLERMVSRQLVYHHRSDRYLAVAVRSYGSRGAYVAEMERACRTNRVTRTPELRVI